MSNLFHTMQNKEWENEPNSVDGEFFGIHVGIRRHPDLKHLCGYAGVTKKHPTFGVQASDYEHPLIAKIEVHGGLTFSAYGLYDTGLPRKREMIDLWFFGFDCAHAWDLVPGLVISTLAMQRNYKNHSTIQSLYQYDTYRNIAYVQRETCKLAWQLAGNDVSDEAGFERALKQDSSKNNTKGKPEGDRPPHPVPA